MKKYLFVLLILTCIVQIKGTDYQGSKTSAAYVQPNEGSPYYAYATFAGNIGKKYSAEAEERETARTKYTFDLTSYSG